MDDELPTARLLSGVGGALANWSMVELQMGLLFTILSDIPDRDKAVAIFDGVISFDTRLAILDRLMRFETDLSETEAEMWTRLSQRLSKFYKKRHELAHFSLSESGGKLAIAPFLTYEKLFNKSVRYLSVEQVAERGEKFTELESALSWFMVRVCQRRPERA